MWLGFGFLGDSSWCPEVAEIQHVFSMLCHSERLRTAREEPLIPNRILYLRDPLRLRSGLRLAHTRLSDALGLGRDDTLIIIKTAPTKVGAVFILVSKCYRMH